MFQGPLSHDFWKHNLGICTFNNSFTVRKKPYEFIFNIRLLHKSSLTVVLNACIVMIQQISPSLGRPDFNSAE